MPHSKCCIVKRCVVPAQHPYFLGACEFRGQTKKNHPGHGKRQQEADREALLAHEELDRGTPSVDGPDEDMEATKGEAAALASFPEGSMLFSPHVANSAYASKVWDDCPLEVESFHDPAPSPSTTVYNNWREDNVERSHYGSSGSRCGMGGNLSYAEEDLPGSTLYYLDDPNAP